jgi:hypothetical protein
MDLRSSERDRIDRRRRGKRKACTAVPEATRREIVMSWFGDLVGRRLRTRGAATLRQAQRVLVIGTIELAGAVRKTEQYRAMQAGYRDLQQQSDRRENLTETAQIICPSGRRFVNSPLITGLGPDPTPAAPAIEVDAACTQYGNCSRVETPIKREDLLHLASAKAHNLIRSTSSCVSRSFVRS